MDELSWYAKRPKDSSLNCKLTRKMLKTDFYSSYIALRKLREELESSFL
jgi:dTDP-4-dehydrorhamnose reductase